MSNKQRLVDIVNLNSDASCLSSKRWLKALEGGTSSELYSILNLYVIEDLKITLGIVGSTLAEIEEFNPECIDLIKQNPHNFELLIRPFIHSLSILWSNDTFSINYKLGKEYLVSIFDNYINWYLPPEFALRNSQVHVLSSLDCQGTFIHPKRVKESVKRKLPIGPFTLASIQNTRMPCISFTENYDTYYLDQMQIFTSDVEFQEEIIYGWRDGESPFFLPDSVKREMVFVKNSKEKFNRIFLSEALEMTNFHQKSTIHSYPQNSLLPWLGNFRLFWYMAEVKQLEHTINELSQTKKIILLNLLNSDILSSTEKNNISITLRSFKDHTPSQFLIKRKERNLDAEEVLYMINNFSDNELEDYIKSESSNFLKKINARYKAALSISI